ncbi:hypothetical protein [Paenibacillus flagellatus]|uniref:hypothetical protein n=1 Tax=Paenibacillus flagellatus TaxID=2211139 RepID=UPI001FECD3B7|nr:hypothetical protein [Paenibacillus flagellatus]
MPAQKFFDLPLGQLTGRQLGMTEPVPVSLDVGGEQEIHHVVDGRHPRVVGRVADRLEFERLLPVPDIVPVALDFDEHQIALLIDGYQIAAASFLVAHLPADDE